ncbi:MAG: hypothetical protein MJE68_21330, partial [Proteobacteria bacterium]|nr:hypothetical protein [Pseudomonadota bacterium]
AFRMLQHTSSEVTATLYAKTCDPVACMHSMAFTTAYHCLPLPAHFLSPNPTCLFLSFLPFSLSLSLSFLTQQHVPVGLVSDGIDVRWHLVTLLASIHLDDLVRVDWVELVGVDHYAEEPRVSLWGKDRGRG